MKRTYKDPTPAPILWRTVGLGVRVMPKSFAIMLLINLIVALLPIFGIRWSRSMYAQAQNAPQGNFQIGLYLTPLLLYSAYLMAMKLYVIFYKRVYIQFGTLLTFEKQIKTILHDKCGRVGMSNYETPTFFNRVWEAKVASINIYRVVECMIYFVSITVSILAMGGYVATIHPAFFSLVALAAFPSLTERIASGLLNSQRRKIITQLEKEERAHRSSVLHVSRYKEIRAYRIAETLINRWSVCVQALQSQVYSRDRRMFWIRSGLRLIKTGATVGAYALSAALFFSGHIDYSGFITTMAAATYLQAQYTELFDDAGYFSEFLLLVKPFFQFMDMEDENLRHVDSKKVALVDVTYRYPTGQSDVLRNLCMHVQRGETIVVVGVNGAGKSTLAKILMGFLAPLAGSYVISNEYFDLINNGNEVYQADCSAMFQDYCKYALSIRENIALSQEPDNRDEHMRELVEQLGLTSLIGNESILGREFGTCDLSGGQWQRVAMARCFYQNKDFYILDEPTSAIDPLQEKEINDRILCFAKGKTMVVISHRLSIARLADRVLVLNDGIIVQEGPHDQLLCDENGLYARLWAAQSTWYQDPIVEDGVRL